jgi:hypothetical protein
MHIILEIGCKNQKVALLDYPTPPLLSWHRQRNSSFLIAAAAAAAAAASDR